jgi:hypothetical protein
MDLEPIADQSPPRAAETQPDSPLVWLKQRHRTNAKRQTRDFLLPGWEKGDGHGLFGRYRRLTVDRCREILTDPDDDQAARNAQLLLEACETLTIRDEHGETIVSPGYTDPLPGLLEDVQLSAAHPWGQARQLVLETFSGDQQAMCGHGADVYEWMNHQQDLDDEEIAGG